MKIGVCAFPLSRNNESGRGLERVIFELCKYLELQNIEFDFYGNSDLDNLKGSASIFHELKAILSSLNYLFKLYKTNNDCYFATYPVAALFPIILKKQPLITVVHDLIPFMVRGYDNKYKYFLKRKCIKYACLNSQTLIVPFLSTKEKIVDLFNIDEKKIIVIPYGVDASSYYPDNSVLKIKNKIAFLGEAKRSKGLDSLIKAFKIVLQQIPNSSLIIASQGNELAQMKQLALEYLPPASYNFLGFIPEKSMNEFYNSADLFVFPSRYGFGLSALEAMACGTPALVGNTLDACDFFNDEDLLVDPEDTKQIAQKIVYLMLDINLKKQKSEQVLKIAQQFSFEEMSKRYYIECLRSLNVLYKS